MQRIITLGIESSCDETSCGIVVDGRKVLANIISSQADFHATFGGVVPEIASRMHVDAIVPVIEAALLEADISYEDISAICVTQGPGLVGALLVGISAAKALCAATGLPLIGVNHIDGHISANYISELSLEPPFVCLVASGGHSQVLHVRDYGKYEVLATTRDDAAGEAFDKIARVLGLGYPGGPKMDAISKNGDESAFSFPRTKFKDSLDFSFSGVKTAALNQINGIKSKKEMLSIEDFAASYQNEITSVLVERTVEAAEKTGCRRICLAGGVSANSALRKKMVAAGEQLGLQISFPPLHLCTDNGAMIAAAGYYRFRSGQRESLHMNAKPSLKLE